MIFFGGVSITIILTSILGAVIIISIIRYNWQRRWFYYYASKIEGPFALPLLGSIHEFMGGREALFDNIMRVLKKMPSVCKIWLGQNLIVITSRPEDLEIIMNNALEKPDFYRLSDDFIKSGLLTAPVSIWKGRRKIINPTFNTKILNYSFESFVTQSNIFVNRLKGSCGRAEDIFPKFWRCVLDNIIATLADVDPASVTGQDEYLATMSRLEELMLTRASTAWLHPNFIWQCTSMYREMQVLAKKTFDFTRSVMEKNRSLWHVPEEDAEDDEKRGRFLNHLYNVKETNGAITDDGILEETQIMFIAGSETTAATLSFVVLVLGMFPDIQEKVYQEIVDVLGDVEKDVTLDDVNRMEYFERVIKETMRLLPTAPIILRYAAKDIQLDSYRIPAGSNILIPLLYMGKKAELWPDPWKFDPDRYLAGESEKRHRCTFMPFSYGPRNCIGLHHGMLSMKVLLSTVVKRYKVKPVDYTAIQDIEYIFNIVAKPKKGCKVILEERE